METIWGVLKLSVIIFFFGLCNGLPINLENSGPDPHTQLLTGLVAVLLTVCSVVLLAGCLCCQRKNGFQEFRDSPAPSSATIISSNLDHGHVNPIANSTSEFTIFTPISPPHHNNNVFLANQRIVSCSQEDQKGGDIDASSWFDGSEKDFPRTKLKYIRELGKGWFGRVVEGTAQNIGDDQGDTEWTPVVVRILEASATSREKLLFLSDASIYKCGYHPNILRLLGRSLDTVPLLLLQEYCPQGDLKKYLKMCKASQDKLVSEDMPLHWCYQLTLALKHLHDQKLTHPDLAARNCQLTENLTLKLGDYGLSAAYYSEDYYQGSPGVPLRWCAPEIISYTSTTIQTTPTTPEANIWALGITMWEILEWGEQPYAGLTDDEVISQVLGAPKVRLSRPTYHLIYTDYMYKMMQSCWYSPESRATVSQLDLMMLDLIHVYENTKVSADMSTESSVGGDPISLDDFDNRWNALKPNFHISVGVEHSDEKKEAPDRGTKSASMNNLHGSLDNLLDNRPFDPMESWLENIASDTSDMSFVRGLNEAITDLDNAIAMENFSSSPEFGKSSIKIGGQITSSESETEDENWRKKIERGAYTEKVRQKSRSVADLMVLTHIDCSESDSETLPSIDSKANQRIRYLKNVDNQKKFGSEGNLLSVHDAFQEELKKLQEERRDSLLFVPDSFSEENAVATASALSPPTPANNHLDSLENSPVKMLLEKLNSPSEMVPPQTVYNVFNVHVQHINVGSTICDKMGEIHADAKTSGDPEGKDSTSDVICDRQLESKTNEEQTGVNSPSYENQNSFTVNNLNQNEGYISHIKTNFNSPTKEKSVDSTNYEKDLNQRSYVRNDEDEVSDIVTKETYPNKIDVNNINSDTYEINSTKINTPSYQDFMHTNDVMDNTKPVLYSNSTVIPCESNKTFLMDERQFSSNYFVRDSLKLNSDFDVKIEILNEQNSKNQDNNAQKHPNNNTNSKVFAVTSRENNKNIKLKVPKLSEIIQRNAIDYKVHNHHNSNDKSTTTDKNDENEKLVHQEVIDKDSGLNTPENSASLEKLYDDNEEILDVGSFDSDRSNEINKAALLTDIHNEDEHVCLKRNEEFSVITYFEENHKDGEEEIANLIDYCQKKETKLICSLFLENERLNYFGDDISALTKLSSEQIDLVTKGNNYYPFSYNYRTDTLDFLQAEISHSSNLMTSKMLVNFDKHNKQISEDLMLRTDTDDFRNLTTKFPELNLENVNAPDVEAIIVQTVHDLNLSNKSDDVPENQFLKEQEKFDSNIKKDKILNEESKAHPIEIIAESIAENIQIENVYDMRQTNVDTDLQKTDSNQNEDNQINFCNNLVVKNSEKQNEVNSLNNLPNQKIKYSETAVICGSLFPNKSTITAHDERSNDSCSEALQNSEIQLDFPTEAINLEIYNNKDKSIEKFESVQNVENSRQHEKDINEIIPSSSDSQIIDTMNDISAKNVDIGIANSNICQSINSSILDVTKSFLANELQTYSNNSLTLINSENVENKWNDNNFEENLICTNEVTTKNIGFKIVPEDVNDRLLQITNQFLIDEIEHYSIEEIKPNYSTRSSEQYKNAETKSESSQICDETLKETIDINDVTPTIIEDLNFNIKESALFFENEIDYYFDNRGILNAIKNDLEENINEEIPQTEHSKPETVNEDINQTTSIDYINSEQDTDAFSLNFDPDKVQSNDQLPAVAKVLSDTTEIFENLDIQYATVKSISDDILDEVSEENFTKSENIVNNFNLTNTINVNNEKLINTGKINEIEQTSIFLKNEIENYSGTERKVDFDVSDTQDKISLNSLTHISTFTSTPFANRRPADSTVILGASDDYSIDYYSGLKTSVDPGDDSNLQFSSNFVRQHNNSSDLYSLETWDNFLGRSFDEQESAAMDFNDFSQEPHSLLFLECDDDNNAQMNELKMTKVLNETYDAPKPSTTGCDNADRTFVKEVEVKQEELNATFDVNTKKENDKINEESCKDNASSNSSGGWFLHPQCNTKETLSQTTQNPDHAATGSSEESYVGFSMDDEVMAAIRNELLTKLPHAQRASSDHQIEENCEEMDSAERNEVFLRYNVYNTPLSPIPEESCDSELGSGRITPKRINDTSDEEDNSSDWSVQEDNNSSNVHTEDIHSPRAHESPAKGRTEPYRHTPSQDSCCSNDTLFNIEELNGGVNDRIMEPIFHLPNQFDSPDSIEEETSGSKYDDCNMDSHVSESDITLQINTVDDQKENISQIPVIKTDTNYIEEFLESERYCEINTSIDGGEEVSSASDIYLTVSDNTLSYGPNVAPLNSPEDRPWKELQASFRSCDEDQLTRITDFKLEEVSSNQLDNNLSINTETTDFLNPNTENERSEEKFSVTNQAEDVEEDDCLISDEDIDKILREDMESESFYETPSKVDEDKVYVNIIQTQNEQPKDKMYVNIITTENEQPISNNTNNEREEIIQYENLKNSYSDEDIYSKIDMEESDDKFSRFEDLFGPLTDIRFSGPGSSSQLMTTSFSESNDLGDDQDWDSGSDTRSSSSGEFIWKEGEHEASVKALRAPPQSDNINYVTPMENIQEEIASADSSRDNSSSSDSDGEDECPEFVPSAWDKYATPTKSALRSPEKTLERNKEENVCDEQPQKEKKSRGVSFKKQKYHCVYEYPREPESPVLQSYDLWKPTSDYTTLSDWDLETDPYMAPTLSDSDVYENPSKHEHLSKNLYHLTTFTDVNIDPTVIDEDFFVSSSSRPFDMLSGLTSQFFPGRQFQGETWVDNSNITPDSGVEDIATPANFGNDTINSCNGLSGTQLTGVQSLKVLAANAVQRSDTKRELGGLRHTRNKLKLDLPPSPSAFTSNKTFSVEPITEEIVPRQVPTFTTFGKSRFLVQHVDTPDSERAEKNVSFEALPHKKPEQSQTFLMEADDWKKDRQKIESVRGEASLLDSADEDSGIESCTLERKKLNV